MESQPEQGDDLIVTVSYDDHDHDHAWVTIAPQIERQRYVRFARRFGASWSRKRKQCVIAGRITAEEIRAFLESTASTR